MTHIDGRLTPTWNAAMGLLVAGVIERSAATVRVIDPEGRERSLQVDLAAIPIDSLAEGNLLRLLGIEPARPAIPAVIGAVTRQGPGPAGRPGAGRQDYGRGRRGRQGLAALGDAGQGGAADAAFRQHIQAGRTRRGYRYARGKGQRRGGGNRFHRGQPGAWL